MSEQNTFEGLKNLAYRTIESNAIRAKNRKLKLVVNGVVIFLAPSDLGYLASIIAEKNLNQEYEDLITIEFVRNDMPMLDVVKLSIGAIRSLCRELRSFSQRIDLLAATNIHKVELCKTKDELIEVIDSIVKSEEKIESDYRSSLE